MPARSWSEADILAALPSSTEAKVVTLESIHEAGRFRMAIYNYLRTNTHLPSVTIRRSGTSLVITRPTPRRPLSISTVDASCQS